MSLTTVVRQVRRGLLNGIAPDGSWQRRALRNGKIGFQRWCWYRRVTGRWLLPPVVDRPIDVYDLPALQRLVRGTPFPLLQGPPPDPTESDAAATGFILRLLWDRPDLRTRFPGAIREGADGPFGRWLTGADSLSGQARANFQAAFARRLGDRIRQAYDHLEELQLFVPLALTPAGRRPFLRWLLGRGRAAYHFRDEEIGWFLHESAEDPAHGLADTYLRCPLWQKEVPLGLTVFGWNDLLAWVRDYYSVADDWLDRAVRPATRSPGDELRQLYTTHPDLQQLAPLAFRTDADTRRLVGWIREHGDRVARLDPIWLDGLERELAEGRLTRPGANVLGHFCHASGLQEAACTTVRALRGMGAPTALRDVPAKLMRDTPHRAEYLDLELYDYSILHFAPEPAVDAFYPCAGLRKRDGVYRIAVWFWELETVPPEWVKYAGVIDEIWAPTRFIGQAMRQVMPIPVIDMLTGCEPGPVPKRPRTHFGLTDDRFLFLFAFDMASVMERKNPLGLIRAFRQAFGGDPRVGLVIKVTRGSADPAGLRQLTEAAHEAGVYVLDRLLPRAEVYALIDSCDCYVSLHRSEGFGYSLAEAMLLGKPCIATGYSGNLDFMTPDNSLLVDYERVPITQNLPYYRKGCIWAEPSVDHAAERMRWVYHNPDAAGALATRGQADARRLLSTEAVGQRMYRRLCELNAGHPLPSLRPGGRAKAA